jgi:hypothetical protein
MIRMAPLVSIWLKMAPVLDQIRSLHSLQINCIKFTWTYSHIHTYILKKTYEGRLQSSWTHLITLSWNFVEVRWRSPFRSTSLGNRCTSYNAPPTSQKRAADRWSLRNLLPRNSLFMVGKAQKSHGARSELNSVFGLEKVDRWNPIRTSTIQFRSRPVRFLGFSSHEKGARRQEISKWSTVCSTFSRSSWSVLRNASLAKGGTSKKRPSPHLHKVSTRSNKMRPLNFQTTLVHIAYTYTYQDITGYRVIEKELLMPCSLSDILSRRQRHM